MKRIAHKNVNSHKNGSSHKKANFSRAGKALSPRSGKALSLRAGKAVKPGRSGHSSDSAYNSDTAHSGHTAVAHAAAGYSTPSFRRKRRYALLADEADIHLSIPTELDDAQKKRRDAVIRGLFGLLVSVIVLLLLGIVMVFSATSARSIDAAFLGSDSSMVFSVALKQAQWVLISVLLCAIVAAFPYKILERLCYWLFALGLILQLLVLIVGTTINGNKNWLEIGPVQIQPSELLKAAMIVWLAHTIGRLSFEEIRRFTTLVIPLIGFTLATGLVILGGDMGTALIYLLIGCVMFWCAGVRNLYLGGLLILGAFCAAVLVALAPSRVTRITDFASSLFSIPDIVEPTQSEFAQFAFGSGGIAGVGIGAGKEKWRDLAEAHTDFIYAVIGEELGLFGTMTVVVLFLVLGWSFVEIARNMNTRFGQLATVGAGVWVCGQGFANMCVVTGLLPVFGVPLPFLSQGGSSMVGVMISIGVVVSCALAVPGVREVCSLRSRLIRKSTAVVKGGTQ